MAMLTIGTMPTLAPCGLGAGYENLDAGPTRSARHTHGALQIAHQSFHDPPAKAFGAFGLFVRRETLSIVDEGKPLIFPNLRHINLDLSWLTVFASMLTVAHHNLPYHHCY